MWKNGRANENYFGVFLACRLLLVFIFSRHSFFIYYLARHSMKKGFLFILLHSDRIFLPFLCRRFSPREGGGGGGWEKGGFLRHDLFIPSLRTIICLSFLRFFSFMLLFFSILFAMFYCVDFILLLLFFFKSCCVQTSKLLFAYTTSHVKYFYCGSVTANRIFLGLLQITCALWNADILACIILTLLASWNLIIILAIIFIFIFKN